MLQDGVMREMVAARVSGLRAEARRGGRRPREARRRSPSGTLRTALGLGLLRAGHRLFGIAEVR